MGRRAVPPEDEALEPRLRHGATRVDLFPERDMFRGAMLGVILVVSTTGCAGWDREKFAGEAADQASFDHRCAKERIRTLRQTVDGMTVELDVCGSVRRYQSVHGAYERRAIWIDTTGVPAATPTAG
jgi:hypothetical protein